MGTISSETDFSSLTFIDTHCHLTLCEVDPAEHIRRAQEQGVDKILDPGLWVTDFKNRYERLHCHPEVLFGLACAPHYRRDSSPETEDVDSLIKDMEEVLEHYPVAALSEIGLDYHHTVRSRESQQELFLRQLNLATQLNLPVFLHIRDAYEDAFDMVVKSGHRRGAVHCFTGGAEDAQKFTDWGFCLSFSGIVTFERSEGIQEIVKNTPDEKILTETDAPFLAPVPLRGKPNQAGNVVYINRTVAELKRWSEDFCFQRLRENARQLIGFNN